MDKVIDGVDVSGCNMKCDNGDCALYYAELNNDNNELIYGFNCSDNPDCYYKQLKRLKQKNEQLYNDLKECGIKREKYRQALQEIRDIADRTDGNHPASVINMVSVIRHTINSVIGVE